MTLLLAMSGCTQPSPGLHADTVVLPPGSGFFEVNLGVDATTQFSVAWATEPSTIVVFNVHSHHEGAVKFFERGSFASYEATFDSSLPEDVSLMWESDDKVTVAISYELRGSFEVISMKGP